MLLELSVLSYHRLSPRQVAVKRFDASGGTLGRSEQSDWYLPDPERVVSGVHARISYQQGQFTISDQSTNGLFINRSVTPLGQGNSHILRDGDTLCLGDYEIQVALVDAMPTNTPAQATMPMAAEPETVADNHIGLRIADIAPLNSASADPAAHRTATSHRVSHSLASPEPELVLDDHFHAPAALIPDDWQAAWQPENQFPLQDAVAPVAAKPQKNSSVLKGNAVEQLPAQACLDAFLQGLGVSDASLPAAGTAQWWEQLGQALQQSLQGVMAVMRERSAVKNSFRVNQTTFQQRENNPLKFSATIDDAFHNLFNRPGSSFMPARQAIAEAFADISRHEAAIIAGASGAMAGLLAELAPQKLEASDFSASFLDKVNPAQRQARLWARYKALHDELSADVNNKDKQGVNDDFISAYEAYLRNS